MTGRVDSAFNTAAFAEAIAWVLSNHERRSTLRKAARERAIRLWNPEVVAAQYADVLSRAAASGK